MIGGRAHGTLVTQFAYNGDGTRTSKTVDSATTQYVLGLAATLPAPSATPRPCTSTGWTSSRGRRSFAGAQDKLRGCTTCTTAQLLPAEGQPSRIKRRFDQARTPFHRLCQTDAISEQQKEQLRTLRDRVNPRRLRQEIYQLIDHIFLLPGAVPGETEDVYETLSTPATSQKGEGIPVALSFERAASLR